MCFSKVFVHKHITNSINMCIHHTYCPAHLHPHHHLTSTPHTTTSHHQRAPPPHTYHTTTSHHTQRVLPVPIVVVLPLVLHAAMPSLMSPVKYGQQWGFVPYHTHGQDRMWRVYGVPKHACNVCVGWCMGG